MINRKLDSPLRTRLNIRFVPKDKLNKIVYKDKYQIVQICWDHLYRKNHILFTTHFTPMNFRYQYQEKLNHNSKIIILGDWRKMTKFYRILDFANYDVYLTK